MSYDIINGTPFYFYDPIWRPSRIEVERFDSATFVVLNRTWAKDKERVWRCGFRLRKVFAPAFRALNESFGCDNECVFDSRGRTIKGLSPASFQPLDQGWIASPEHRSGNLEGYARCDGSIYHYDHFDHKATKLRGADAATFEVLPRGFARDAKKVFHGYYVAKNARPVDFHLIGIDSNFWTDGRKVFYFTREVPLAHPESFEYLGGILWAKDRERVYTHDRLFLGPDASSTRLVGDLIKDDQNVYGITGRVNGADAATFERVGDSEYYRDKNHIFISEIGEGWQTIPEVDLASFRPVPSNLYQFGDAQDANWFYRGAKRLMPSCDLASALTDNDL